MSSRIIRREEPASVSAIAWRKMAFRPDKPKAAGMSPASTGGLPASDSELERQAFLEREIKRAESEAYRQGLAEGEASGRKQAATEAAAAMQAGIDRLTRALANLADLRAVIRRDSEGDLIKLTIAIARKILHRELILDPDGIHALIKVALEKLQASETHRVRVNPSHAQAVEAGLARFASGRGIEVVADASLAYGDVLFETERGSLDASIDFQLREIERGFADRIAG